MREETKAKIAEKMPRAENERIKDKSKKLNLRKKILTKLLKDKDNTIIVNSVNQNFRKLLQ